MSSRFCFTIKRGSCVIVMFSKSYNETVYEQLDSVCVCFLQRVNVHNTFSTVLDTQDTIKKGSLRLPENTTSYVFISALAVPLHFSTLWVGKIRNHRDKGALNDKVRQDQITLQPQSKTS